MRGRDRDMAMVQCLGIAALCLLVLAPAAAVAATANTRIKRVFYAAAPGEVNTLTISLAGADYLLADPGATITAAPACVGHGLQRHLSDHRHHRDHGKRRRRG